MVHCTNRERREEKMIIENGKEKLNGKIRSWRNEIFIV
jgi:hypothetical protein